MEIYRSIEGNTNLIQVDPKTNPNCVVGANIQEVLAETYSRLQKKVEEEMAVITLDGLIKQIALSEKEKRPENQPLVEKFL